MTFTVKDLSDRIDDLITEQAAFMADYNTSLEVLQKHINALQNRLHRLENKGQDD